MGVLETAGSWLVKTLAQLRTSRTRDLDRIIDQLRIVADGAPRGTGRNREAETARIVVRGLLDAQPFEPIPSGRVLAAKESIMQGDDSAALAREAIAEASAARAQLGFRSWWNRRIRHSP